MPHPTPPTSRWLDTASLDLVRDFWQAAGGEEPLPRRLEQPLALALPVSLVKIARLHLRHAEQWLRARGRSAAFDTPTADRPLHGCLLAQNGHGIIFLDGADSPDEMRFTLAHEIGHFLADALQPRRWALATFGPHFAAVLDGERAPTTAERISLLLHGRQVGPCVNLMERAVNGSDALEVWQCEDRADRIALALLAPPDMVLAAARGGTHAERMAAAESLLVEQCGLPPTPAHRYAAALLATHGRAPSWAEFLRAR